MQTKNIDSGVSDIKLPNRDLSIHGDSFLNTACLYTHTHTHVCTAILVGTLIDIMHFLASYPNHPQKAFKGLSGVRTGQNVLTFQKVSSLPRRKTQVTKNWFSQR